MVAYANYMKKHTKYWQPAYSKVTEQESLYCGTNRGTTFEGLRSL